MEGALAPLGTGAARFFRWWIGELAVLLPAGWLTALKRERRQLVVTLADGEAVIYRCRGGKLRELGSVALAGQPDGEVAERVNRLVMRDRHGVDEVVLRLPHGSVLVIDLAVVPRVKADDAIGRLVSWDLDPDRLESEDAQEAKGERFNLLPISMVRPSGGGTRRLTATGAVVACVLLAVALYLPIRERQEFLTAAEARLATAQAEAAEAIAIGEQVAELRERGEYAIGLKSSRPIFEGNFWGLSFRASIFCPT